MLPSFTVFGAELVRRGMPAPPLSDPLELWPKQLEIFERRMDTGNKCHTTVIGGAFGGGKSIIALTLFNSLALKYPGSHWTICRKTFKNAKETIAMDFKKFFYGYYVKWNESTQKATYANGSMIVFRGENRDKDPDLHAWKSFGTCGFFLEQIEEMSEDFYKMALSRAGRWRTKESPPSFVLCSVNPTPGWPYTKFYRPAKDGSLPDSMEYIPMLIQDNPSLYNDKEYMAKFEDMDPIFKAAFLEGDWEVLLQDEAQQLFPNEWLTKAVERWHEREKAGTHTQTTAIGSDVARGGADETVFALRSGAHVKKIVAHPGATTATGHDFVSMLSPLVTDTVAKIIVDVIGVGSSAIDYSRDSWGDKVVGFNASESGWGYSPEGWQYGNIKAELFWYIRQRLHPEKDNPISLPPDDRLLSDLRAMRFELRSGRLYVEKKDDLKKRLGRSPDRGEAAIISFLSDMG